MSPFFWGHLIPFKLLRLAGGTVGLLLFFCNSICFCVARGLIPMLLLSMEPLFGSQYCCPILKGNEAKWRKTFCLRRRLQRGPSPAGGPLVAPPPRFARISRYIGEISAYRLRRLPDTYTIVFRCRYTTLVFTELHSVGVHCVRFMVRLLMGEVKRRRDWTVRSMY